MANTYTKIYVHLIFAVQGRISLISEKYRSRIEKYISGIITNNKSKTIAIYCTPNHTHILIGLHPSISVSEIAKTIKANSSRWINEQGWFRGKFEWQNGFGAFTYSKSQLNSVVKYILNQGEHHRRVTFREEYIDFLKKFGIDYNEKYLFN